MDGWELMRGLALRQMRCVVKWVSEFRELWCSRPQTEFPDAYLKALLSCGGRMQANYLRVFHERGTGFRLDHLDLRVQRDHPRYHRFQAY